MNRVPVKVCDRADCPCNKCLCSCHEGVMDHMFDCCGSTLCNVCGEAAHRVTCDGGVYYKEAPPVKNPLIEQAASDRHERPLRFRTCKVCDSNVSSYNCNPTLVKLRPEASAWDWWYACDNGNCEHAYGEGYFQAKPDWVKAN